MKINKSIESLNLKELKPYKNNPFKGYEFEELKEIAESIATNGLLSPIVLWYEETGGEYIILSGHNRVKAMSNILNYTTIDKYQFIIYQDLREYEAEEILVTANLEQRMEMLPSERAKAYQIRLKFMEKTKENGDQKYDEKIQKYTLEPAETEEDKKKSHGEKKESKAQFYRYLRLNFLIETLLQKVDDKKLGMVQAAQISYLKQEEQMAVFRFFYEIERKPKIKLDKTLAKAIREKAKATAITIPIIEQLLKKKEKESKKQHIKLKFKDIKQLAKSSNLVTPSEAEEYIKKCISFFEEMKQKGHIKEEFVQSSAPKEIDITSDED